MQEFHFKDTRRQQMDHNAIRPAHESHRFPGHEQRMADHARRIRSANCWCGSGKAYGDCCILSGHERSAARPAYTLPESVHPDATVRDAIEDRLRLQGFIAFYKGGQEEHDLLLRFVRAVVRSADPIHGDCQLRRWQESFCTRPSRNLREAGQ